MQNQLKNKFLTIEVDSFGAELHSIQHDSVEYLWQADPEFWARHAPVLFPIVGKLKNGSYQYAGKTYKMGGHGFARDNEFELIESSSDELIYELTDNESTRENYPWQFTLQIGYKLVDNQIHVSYTVKNQDEKEMLFSIGAHPAFNVPLAAGSFENYSLTFSPQVKRTFYPIDMATGNLRLADKTWVNDYKKKLTRELFSEDALIYSSVDKTSVTLSNNLDARSVKLSWHNMPYFGLWSPYPKEAPFVCIEPWAGIADDMATDGNFATKFGINKLAPAAEFKREYSIEIN